MKVSHPSLTGFFRSLSGVSPTRAKGGLVDAGVLYWDVRKDQLQPHPRYCLCHFEVSGRAIRVLPAGQKLITKLYNKGQLTMKQGYVRYGSGVSEP